MRDQWGSLDATAAQLTGGSIFEAVPT